MRRSACFLSAGAVCRTATRRPGDPSLLRQNPEVVKFEREISPCQVAFADDVLSFEHLSPLSVRDTLPAANCGARAKSEGDGNRTRNHRIDSPVL